jgi:hypothetical protein
MLTYRDDGSVVKEADSWVFGPQVRALQRRVRIGEKGLSKMRDKEKTK